MRVLVVFESIWGNTRTLAEAMARALEGTCTVSLVDSDTAPVRVEGYDLVIVGGPTHAFSMSRLSTREGAISRGASSGGREVGLREWVGALPSGAHAGRLATFDTRVASVRHLPGSAAKAAGRLARRHGYPLAGVESFYVDDVEGPLLEGETVRATEWGRALARAVVPAE